MHFVLLYRKNLDKLVKILNCSTLIFVGFCYLLLSQQKQIFERTEWVKAVRYKSMFSVS